MRFYISSFSDKGINTITLEHRGEKITWDAKLYNRASRINGQDEKPNPDDDMVFREINRFLVTRPIDAQDRIWTAYKGINALFEGGYDPLTAQNRWQDLVGDIYKELPYDALHEWVGLSGVVEYPPNVKTEYGHKDPEDLTYLRSDYFDLAVLAIAMRPMVPIWGEYIPRLKTDISTTDKEYVGSNLIFRTYLPSCTPYERLRRYMEASIASRGNQSVLASVIHSGLSSDAFPDWLLACTLVRRTSVVPIVSTADGPNIITDVFQFVKTALMSSGSRRFSGPMTDKKPRKEDSADKQESLAESYKIKQPLSDGDLESAEMAMQDVLENAQAIDPSIDPKLVDASIRTMEKFMVEPLTKHQQTLTQWVMHSVLSMRYLPLLTKSTQLKAMACAHALLWHWEFTELAALLSATEVKRDEDEFISPREGRADKLSKETCDALATLFPFQATEKHKNVTFRQCNFGYVCVDTFYELLAGKDWYLHGPEALLARTTRLPGTRKLYLPVDLREQVAHLLIALHGHRAAFRSRTLERMNRPL